jgi:hypothetical protein
LRDTTLFKVMVVFFIVFTSITAHAYTMADYWAFNEGNIWVYDRDLQLMGSETHVFSQYTGRLLIQLTGFYDNHPFVYSGSEGVMVVGMYIANTKQYIDFSATPIKMTNAEMNIGDSVTNNIPAGVIDEDAISITVTLEAVENVTVPARTYNDALRVKVYIVDGIGTYTEHIWLAKNVGAVKMYRVTETNNTPGCFFTCASFDQCSENLVDRTIQLRSFIQGKAAVKNRPIIIPLGD